MRGDAQRGRHKCLRLGHGLRRADHLHLVLARHAQYRLGLHIKVLLAAAAYFSLEDAFGLRKARVHVSLSDVFEHMIGKELARGASE